MQRFFLVAAILISALAATAQHTFKAKIVNKETGEPISGATVTIKAVKKITAADSAGFVVINNIPEGKYLVKITSVGFAIKEETFQLPLSDDWLTIEMEAEHEEEDEVIIESTRSTRTIRDIPTRVEFVAGEELDEKANMKPGDIRMVLNESTGITTQQTSALSANASIRIQGLDGRYTQILRDGFPLFAGFSGGLGLLQTPPLDLKQFEVIKGSTSTLYGGGAIAGLVNLISKTPTEERELKFHIDLTSAGGINTSVFYGKKFNKTGLTLFASRNSNKAFDPADIGLTAIPKFERYTVNPQFYWYINDQTDLQLGANITTEDRTGGDIEFIKRNKASGYTEVNNTDRISARFSFERRFRKNSSIKIKNSINHFKRLLIVTADDDFNGIQISSFTEVTYANHDEKSEWIAGINLMTDNFDERLPLTSSFSGRDYKQLTTGAFVQNNFEANEKFTIETGLRGDYVKNYGFALLPRISMLFKFSSKLSSRIGGGFGYKMPDFFTEESERLQYKNILPVDENVNTMERSYGVNADINYRTKFADDKISLGINHLFFYTRIHDPLVLRQQSSMLYQFTNANGHFDSRGMETNIKLGYCDFKLFIGYTNTKAYMHEGNIETENYLTSRHRLNSVLLYEVEEKWKVGLEAYYFSKQQLSDNTTGRAYWITGFMVEKLWEKISLYINFENFTDTRQTKFDSIYTGSISNPVFKDIYAPLDGFVVNGGIKLRL
ncbi:MAG TPA: TonB-dependent receptor [Chitinophagaceae bacterium]|nr:TonB-dependent receptor [Chitinophagaceae bacterium]